jgi:DNA-binding beta-propeller fold protein YncE
MGRPGLATLLAGLFLASGALAAWGAGRDYLFVQATMSKDIHVIDAESFQTVDRILIGDYTDDVIGSPAGPVPPRDPHHLSADPVAWLNDAGKILAIDTATDKIIWSTFVEGSPHHLAVSPDGARLYVPLFDKNYLLVLDAHSGQLLQRWYSTLGNHSLEISRDGSRLYAGNMFADLIWVYDTATGKVVKVMRVGQAVRPLRLDPQGTHIIYQQSRFHGFTVRDVATGEITRSVDLPALPSSIRLPDAYPYTVDHGLAVTPDGTKLLAAGSIAAYVAVYRMPE